MATTRRYTPKTPARPDGRQPPHPEGRGVKDRRDERNLAMPEQENALLRVAQQSTAWSWAPLRAEIVGSGSYGTAFRAAADRPTLNAMKAGMSRLLFSSMPDAGRTIIIKTGRAQNDTRVQQSVREAAAHKSLWAAPCPRIPGATRPPCPGEYVPRFYFAGVASGAEFAPEFVNVMDLAPGVPLEKYLARRPMTPELYVKLERALAAIWAAGYVHNDAHKGNLMYDARTGRVSVIDFGFVVRLSAGMATAVRDAIARGLASDDTRSLGELWRSGARSAIGVDLTAYANRVMATRNPWMDFYTPDGNSLMRWYNLLSDAQRAEVPALRRRAWGVGGSVSPVSTPSPTSRLAAAAAVPLPQGRRSASRSASRSAAARSAAARSAVAAAAAGAVSECDRSRNPATWRCASTSGRLGRRIGLAELRTPACINVRNPGSGRCVLRAGRIGRQVLAGR